VNKLSSGSNCFFSHIYSGATQVCRTGHLELNVVGVLSAGETELRLEVTLHVRGSGDGSEESRVDALLVGLSLLRCGVLLLGLLEDTFLGLLGGLVSLEVGVVDVLGDGDLGDVDNGGGSNDLVGDGSSDWDTVDLKSRKISNTKFFEIMEEKNNFYVTLYGPVTRRSPDSSCFKKTTLLPRAAPVRRMRTDPGTMEDRRVCL